MDDLIAKGYTPLWYIESDGTQYIDTGFKPNNNTKVEIGILSSQSTGSNVWLFGAQTSWGKNGYAVSTYTAEFGNSTTTSGIILHDGVKHDVVFDKGVLASDGTTLWSATSTFQTEYNMAVFAINSSGEISGFIGRVYYCKIYDNGTLIRDYVPAKNSDGVCGLYDKVNDVFYASATDSGFTGVAMGSNGMPLGYTRCEYIESDGTNYIDTGVIVNKSDNKKMEITARFTNDAYGGANGYMQFKSGIAINTLSTITVEYALNVEKIYVDGTLDSTTDWTDRYSGENVKLGIFKLGEANDSWHEQDAQTGRVYSCKIYDNGTLIRDYIPCQTNDGVYGLWDDVNKDFYPSSTSIGFTGKWAENKMLDVSLAEFRHRLMKSIKIESGLPVGTIFNFDYTGTVQEVTLPKGYYQLECWGAQGGDSSATTNYKGGRGGYSVGVYNLAEPATLFIVVGGAGVKSSSTSASAGGYNGGGNGGIGAMAVYGISHGGAGGGGATHIATITGLLSSLSSNKSKIVIVAGGGGGMSGVSEGGGTSLDSTLAASGGAAGGTQGLEGGSYRDLASGYVADLSGEGGGYGTNSEAGSGGDPFASEIDDYDNKYSGSAGGGGGAGYFGGGGGAGGSVAGNGSFTLADYGGSGFFGQGGLGGNGADRMYGYFSGVGGGGGGGAGFVSTSLSDARTIAGNTSFPNPSGGTETGHSGNGYARITVVEKP